MSKTIRAATVKEWVNTRLETPDSTTSVSDLTPEQAFRLGAASLLEQILHATGNYHGYTYQASQRDETGLRLDYDDTRRVYF